MPAGGGLVASSASGPAQGEGGPGAGDQLCGQAGQPRVLGDRQSERGDARRAVLAAAGGHRRVA